MMGTAAMNKFQKKVQFVIKLFVTANELTTLKLLNKILISLKLIMVLCCIVNFEQF